MATASVTGSDSNESITEQETDGREIESYKESRASSLINHLRQPQSSNLARKRKIEVNLPIAEKELVRTMNPSLFR